MSLHPSLQRAGKLKKEKTVLKRIERVKHLIAKGTWQDGTSPFGLPKIKIVKIKTVSKKRGPEQEAEQKQEETKEKAA